MKFFESPNSLDLIFPIDGEFFEALTTFGSKECIVEHLDYVPHGNVNSFRASFPTSFALKEDTLVQLAITKTVHFSIKHDIVKQPKVENTSIDLIAYKESDKTFHFFVL